MRVSMKVKELDYQSFQRVSSKYLQNPRDKVGKILAKFYEDPGRRFLVSWRGNKVPRGANIIGYKITSIQHGMVYAKQDECIGTYERLVSFGGWSGRKQMIIVYLYPQFS